MLCQCYGAQEGDEDESKNTTEGKEVQKAIQKPDDWKKKRLCSSPENYISGEGVLLFRDEVED